MYLILNKENKVVAEEKYEHNARAYVKARPYLRYEKFELPESDTNCDLDEITPKQLNG